MCVLTLSGIATGLTIAASAMGTALGVVSSVQNSKAQEAQANYQIQLQRENEKIAKRKAQQEAQEGLNKERVQRMKNLQKIGAQRASLASHGADINFGTPLDLLEDTATGGELDALNIRYDTQKRVSQYNQNAIDYSNQASYLSATNEINKNKNTLTGLADGLGALSKFTGSLKIK